MNTKKITTIFIGVLLALIAAEVLIRLTTANMKNYEIEMWRYAKELKTRSANVDLNHEHIKSKRSILQNVEVRINRYGFRGEDLDYRNYSRRIYFIGGSMLLGWGLPENEIATTIIQQRLPKNAVAINGGVGNYNAERYVAQFFDNVDIIDPTDVVVLFYLRDAEKLDSGSDSSLLRVSQFATLSYSAYKKVISLVKNSSLESHYRAVYSTNSEGFSTMKASLLKLKEYTEKRKINFQIFLLPDFSNLKEYKFFQQRDQILEFCRVNGLRCRDTLPAFEPYKSEHFMVMRGDPHPNAKANKIIADVILKDIL